MTVVKISALPAATGGNVTDTTVLPLVDSTTTTVKVTVAQLRTQLNNAAQTFAGAVTITTGGLNISAGGLAISGTGSVSVIANTAYHQGRNSGGTAYNMIGISANDVVVLGDLSNAIYPSVGTLAAASLAVGAAAKNGALATDSTNNRLIYYSGGNRYYLTGTSF